MTPEQVAEMKWTTVIGFSKWKLHPFLALLFSLSRYAFQVHWHSNC